MRRLFEVSQLSVRLHQGSDEVTNEITLRAGMLPQVAEAAGKDQDAPHTQNRPPPQRAA